MSRSNFTSVGLDLGNDNQNMTYLYGLSDFFAVMFESTEKVNTVLEAGAQGASEVYSRFLQLTSTISLQDIQTTLGQTLKLVTIKSTDAVEGLVNVYSISDEIISSKFIANRPFLPTALFQENVDYRIEVNADGTHQIRFAKDISNAGFSTRTLADGFTREYALWFVDAELDEKWISKHYGNIIGLPETDSTELFKNLVYGLYYTFINGPTLDQIRKGLNLCLGVPLARGNETVLDIRKYPETDQYIVITDANQYILPNGLEPDFAVGDNLKLGDEISKWVEVKDYPNDGKWWINLQIPENLIRSIPAGQKDRYATAGSLYDQLMTNYLSKHTFLVNVKVKNFKNNQLFIQLSDVIRRAKPSYTKSIYIWTISGLTETLDVNDDQLVQQRGQSRCEHLASAISRFHRADTVAPLKRGCPQFVRFNVSEHVGLILGQNTYANGFTASVEGSPVTGYINTRAITDGNNMYEASWVNAVLDRGNEAVSQTRGMMNYSRQAVGNPYIMYSTDGPDVRYPAQGTAVHPLNDWLQIPFGYRIIPMYVTTQTDIASKCQAAGIRTPDMSEWTFKLFDANTASQEINALAINDLPGANSTSLLAQNYSTFATRGASVTYLGTMMPDTGLVQWQPANGASDIVSGDYLQGVRIADNLVGIYLVTSNYNIKSKFVSVIADSDQMEITFTAAPNRALARTNSPYYVGRGRGIVKYNNTTPTGFDTPMGSSGELATTTVDTSYSDTEDPTRTTIHPPDRSGAYTIKHRMQSRDWITAPDSPINTGEWPDIGYNG